MSKHISEIWDKIPTWDEPREMSEEIERLKTQLRKQANVILNMRNCYNCVKKVNCSKWEVCSICSDWEGVF